MSEPDALITRWQSAFARVNGREAPPVTYDRGWFRIDNSLSSPKRRAQLERMADLLESRAQSSGL